LGIKADLNDEQERDQPFHRSGAPPALSGASKEQRGLENSGA